jgi:hypothetical protein
MMTSNAGRISSFPPLEKAVWADGHQRGPAAQGVERENSELKKMLAESLLKNRVLEAVCEKKL